MKTWIYSWIAYPTLYCIARMLGLFSTKTRETLKLRSWKNFLSLRFNAGQPIEYWIHVASYGELEYAYPILRELQLREKRILVTYYSISAKDGVEKLPRIFPNVSLVVPLPHDGLGFMKEFVALLKKQGVHHLLLMKYELWPGLLWECNRLRIKVLLVDALKPSWFHRRLLHKLDGILSGYQSEVRSIAHHNVWVVGDTRVERVLERFSHNNRTVSEVLSKKIVERLSESMTLVCGSMWKQDTNLIFDALEGIRKQKSISNIHLVWVPHELDEELGMKTKRSLEKIGYEVLYSRAKEFSDIDILSDKPLAVIVMQKGFLAELYRLGSLAYVGGGFGRGVHSVWEPALVGARVACGPHTKRSPESLELENRNILTKVHNSGELQEWLMASSSLNQRIEGDLNALLVTHQGAAKRIVEICEDTK